MNKTEKFKIRHTSTIQPIEKYAEIDFKTVLNFNLLA